MSLFPKFKASLDPVATLATSATQLTQSSKSSESSSPPKARNRPMPSTVVFPQPTPESWPCPHCGREATIEAVEPSLDGERILTFWHCEPCQSYAVTPSTIKEPPKGWGTKREQ